MPITVCVTTRRCASARPPSATGGQSFCAFRTGRGCADELAVREGFSRLRPRQSSLRVPDAAIRLTYRNSTFARHSCERSSPIRPASKRRTGQPIRPNMGSPTSPGPRATLIPIARMQRGRSGRNSTCTSGASASTTARRPRCPARGRPTSASPDRRRREAPGLSDVPGNATRP